MSPTKQKQQLLHNEHYWDLLKDEKLNFLFTTQLFPCPYLPNRKERKIVSRLTDTDSSESYSSFLAAGYRRSGFFSYMPACPQCNACIPFRVPISNFIYKNSLKRVTKLNHDLTSDIRSPIATKEHYDLFQRYQKGRHQQGDMANMSFDDFNNLVNETSVLTWLAEYRTRSHRLLGVSIFDEVDNAISAIYTFYDPMESKRSLGTHMILDLIKISERKKKKYLYLGFWIEDNPKMAYKARFTRGQIFKNGTWINAEKS